MLLALIACGVIFAAWLGLVVLVAGSHLEARDKLAHQKAHGDWPFIHSELRPSSMANHGPLPLDQTGADAANFPGRVGSTVLSTPFHMSGDIR